MSATPFDSSYLSALFPTTDTARLLSDSAEVRAMMLVEGMLAEAQGEIGMIPLESALFLKRASLECQIDPAGLADSTAVNGVPVPGLVAAFRKAMEAPEHAQYLHWGATSQDILDSGLMLRMRQALALAETDLRTLLAALATLAEAEADTPMAARTYGQHATPTTFGAQVAGWGRPLLRALAALPDLRRDALWVSLAGAAGTGAVFGDQAGALRAALADKLGLHDPGHSWHSDRGPILAIAGWLTGITLTLGKIGEDLILATNSDSAEVRLGGAGGSSTMPQKQNPVAPSALVALARHSSAQHGALQAASLHRQARDGAAWFTEWLTLSQLVLGAAAARSHALRLVPGLTADRAAMADKLTGSGGLLMAEALSFALTDRLPRPEAQAAVKALCLEARDTGQMLEALARAAYPDLPEGLFDAPQQTGAAPQEAQAFAKAVRAAL